MHLNRDYVRNGKLDIKKLFLMVEAEVDAASKGLNERIKLLCNVISSPKKPLAGILLPKIIKDGYHECLKENCLNLPDDNIFCLRGGSKLPLELFKNGIKSIRNIPSSVKLNGKQKIQEDCAIRNTAHIDKAKIEGFLRQLKYPVYYLDFETFNCAIPMFDGVKPFSNIPFQFSLHVVEKENAKPVHYQYLYRGFSDPRREFILELKKALGNSGSIVAFNESFEKSVLKALAERFPSDKKWIDLTLSKFVDLILPFRDFSYYNPRQYGSASLKEVLPALTGKSYSGMQISGGMEASDKYFLATYKKDSGLNREKVLNDLLEYCGLDTYGMVMIVDKLKGMV